MIARHASSSKFEYPEFRSMAEIEPRYRSSVGELLWEIFEIKGESVWTPREKKTTHISGTAKLSHQETAPVAGTMAAGDRGSSRGNREPPPGFPLPLTSHLGPPDNYIPKASDSRYTISPEHYRDMPGGQYGPAPSYIMSAPRNEPFQASQDLPIRQSALNPVLRPRTSRRPEEAFETTGRKDDEDNDSDPEADTQRRHQRDRQPRRKKDERAHKGTRPKELTSSDDDDYDSEHGKHSRNHRRRHTPPPKTTLPPPKPIPPILKPSTSSGPREGDWEKHDGVWQKFSHGRWRNPKKYDTRRIADGKKVVYDGRDWRR